MKISQPKPLSGEGKYKIPVFISNIKAGFPSPADDFIDKKISLDEELITHPEATYFVIANGDSMKGDGIFSGDILIVDKSRDPYNGCIVIASINGEFTVKKFQVKNRHISLMPSNKNYTPININKDSDFEIWGTVTYVIHKLYK